MYTLWGQILCAPPYHVMLHPEAASYGRVIGLQVFVIITGLRYIGQYYCILPSTITTSPGGGELQLPAAGAAQVGE